MTDSIRKLVDRMTDEEHMLLAERDAAARQSASLTLAAGSGGLALAAAIMLLLLQAIRREHLRREETEQRLQGNNVELAQSLDRVRELGREMTILGSMADLLQSCRSLDEARPVIQSALSELLPRNAGAVCLLNASLNHMETVLEWTSSAEAHSGTQSVFSPDQCWALRRGRAHVVDGAAGQQCLHLARPAPARYACLPMMAQGETLGVMFVQGDDATTEDRLRVVRTASEQIALALANLRLQESLRTQSIRDPLTGLFNRRYLEASLEREIARARRSRHGLCVVMLDVDHFKRFNDTHGHDAGDAVLVEVATVLKGVTREDDIACRYGGEEFTLILPDATIEIARERAEQVRTQIRKLLLEHRRKSLGTITASLGIASFPEDSSSPSGLVQAADAALYRAKQQGRDRTMLAAEITPPDGRVDTL
jgi:diguanylate cyclase (GGDEF)-like protein